MSGIGPLSPILYACTIDKAGSINSLSGIHHVNGFHAIPSITRPVRDSRASGRFPLILLSITEITLSLINHHIVDGKVPTSLRLLTVVNLVRLVKSPILGGIDHERLLPATPPASRHP